MTTSNSKLTLSILPTGTREAEVRIDEPALSRFGIQNDADLVVALHQDTEAEEVVLRVLKNRHGGCREVRISFATLAFGDFQLVRPDEF